MIFKISEDKQDSTFVESMHTHNISEETLKTLKKTKQPALPILYTQTFQKVLAKMPQEIQDNIQELANSYTQGNRDPLPEDMKVNFDNVVKLLHYVAGTYKKIQKFQNEIKIINKYIHPSLQKSELLKISELLSKSINTSSSLISSEISKLKKEYMSVKRYVQNIHDDSIYHPIYTTAYNEDFFFSALSNDISITGPHSNFNHGVFCIRLNKNFINDIKKNTGSATPDELKLQLDTIKQTLSISILRYLRRVDYLGVFKEDNFIVTLKEITLEVLEILTKGISNAINQTSLFTISDFVKVDIVSIHLDVPNINISDIKTQLDVLLKLANENKDETHIIKSMSKLYD